MCACGGTGRIITEHTWGVVINPCPDTNCEYDRNKNRQEYEKWRRTVTEKLGNIFEEEDK